MDLNIIGEEEDKLIDNNEGSITNIQDGEKQEDDFEVKVKEEEEVIKANDVPFSNKNKDSWELLDFDQFFNKK